MNINSDLQLRKISSLINLSHHEQLHKQRALWKAKRNAETLPDFSDHCPPAYLELIENLGKSRCQSV